ncbi:assimilatory sulfite reductase (NADPH) flavoprotein subunit [Staphylococcus pettenkoferi]|uniref:assimilatory sulfite reductase (NADPH) flavoprotein subunit n=1 Tax=Staphylococcus pettenkoferi TaxID=170573 RepID=UPI00066E0894|nr:assimilatory sulfite reductase (NADPH) flavoprotein subunit [Staphylococcus pettenkoferi]MCI2803665.1 assimilatory sulfite reductase (NADPH) flavoprotein subunit [Staphylococcus pettenkoferi]MCY1574403.1 assimilatory sulfite reductase (NADPH) flavoprotein subunit [Staphylococcus pettenkoferi]MCY1577446.1 assimilatory sulfite reductase (NADPH) flavoprotein subunit [Staphylococcus pettenkoferi]MCY1585267.1 assimilatory sulfite reductase (NADPH) flavoprotein subunit [Staphylococcus pettenkoferi
MNLNVTNSPLTEEQAAKANELLASLTPEQKMWFSGYITATQHISGSTTGEAMDGATSSDSTANLPSGSAQSNVAQPKARDITVLYGSETGNAQGVAEMFGERLQGLGHTVEVKGMDEIKPRNIKKVEDLFIVTATHGEGDPPDNAIELHEFLHGRKAPKLEGVRFSVLALGDQSYDHFCQTGKDFDAKLEELGAERLYERIDCDVDYDEDAEKWIAKVIDALNEETGSTAQAEEVVSETIQSEKQQKHSKANPFYTEVLENINLNGRGSAKETRHIELLLEDFNEEYEPGDCLVVLPENDPELVKQLIETLEWDPEQDIVINEDEDKMTLQDALTRHFEITRLTKPLVQKAATLFNNDELAKKEADSDWIKSYIDGRDLIDLIQDFKPDGLKPDDLYGMLRKLPPREYSIASSYQAAPDEVHITVGAARYQAHGRDRSGVCSIQLAERIEPGDTVPIYLKHNPNFKFPKDEETPVIMIGPGTGVAPFRSYMQEREELELEGNTWLFFGNQHFRTDFLYQTEWQSWLEDGYLERMDVAFSRDTDDKVYVQHKIKENAKLFNEWLDRGASIYVCGDEKYMAKDVHEAIKQVISQERQISEDDAEEFLKQLKRDKKYQRDIY